jgi:hypothetical protein
MIRAKRHRAEARVSSVLLGILLLACGEGEGSIRVTAYGESFIEDGIPAEAMNDGWAVAFNRFTVALTDVQVATVAIEVPGDVDLSLASEGRGHELGSADVNEGSYGDASFTLERLELAGAATRGAETKRFAWRLDVPTAYDACETRTSVPDGGVGTFQITIHADHLFYDSLVAEEPQVLFQALADADVDGDGEITQAELGARNIGAYDAGSEGGVENLWEWLLAAARTVGHVDGEGHCEAHPLGAD